VTRLGVPRVLYVATAVLEGATLGEQLFVKRHAKV
jgi:hypothetical protein